MIKLIPFLIALAISTIAFGQEANKETQCRNIGALVMGSWHRLDLCILHKQLKEREVLEARRLITKTYPKIGSEVAAGSDLSLYMKKVANGFPYDFSDSHNTEILAHICKSSIGAMKRYADADWKKELVCWR